MNDLASVGGGYDLVNHINTVPQALRDDGRRCSRSGCHLSSIDQNGEVVDSGDKRGIRCTYAVIGIFSAKSERSCRGESCDGSEGDEKGSD